MDRVVLHLWSGPADVPGCVVDRTEKLLLPFACRAPPVFAPWFPPSPTYRQRALRPAKPAPAVTSAGTKGGAGNRPQSHRGGASEPGTADGHGGTLDDETAPPRRADGPPPRRSWSVFVQRGVLLPARSPSKRFRHMVSAHRLHPRQRARWTITQQNCGEMEQVWRSLSRSIRGSRLPTCNANMQRQCGEIWVFCDVLYSEQVGHLLKDQLQLSGVIRLSVHRRGNVFSM